MGDGALHHQEWRSSVRAGPWQKGPVPQPVYSSSSRPGSASSSSGLSPEARILWKVPSLQPINSASTSR
jgi:hypothetical protein